MKNIKIAIATDRPLSGVETTAGNILFETKLTYDNYLDLETKKMI